MILETKAKWRNWWFVSYSSMITCPVAFESLFTTVTFFYKWLLDRRSYSCDENAVPIFVEKRWLDSQEVSAVGCWPLCQKCAQGLSWIITCSVFGTVAISGFGESFSWTTHTTWTKTSRSELLRNFHLCFFDQHKEWKLHTWTWCSTHLLVLL